MHSIIVNQCCRSIDSKPNDNTECRFNDEIGNGADDPGDRGANLQCVFREALSFANNCNRNRVHIVSPVWSGSAYLLKFELYFKWV